MSVILNMLLIIFSLIGIADAGYITYEEFADVPSLCQNVPGFDCGAVLDSQWAHIGPIPVSILGILFYLTMLILASYHLVTVKPDKRISHFLLFVASSGFAFTLFLLYLQAFIIGAFCLYCVISAVTSTVLFLTTGGFLWLRSKKSIEKSDRDQTAE